MNIINEGLKNYPVGKPVACNLIEEIFKKRDEILRLSENTEDKNALSTYQLYYKDDFDIISEHGSCANEYSLGNCVSFIFTESDTIDDKSHRCSWDVMIYSSEFYLSEWNSYSGLCKLPNGADILVLNIFGEEVAVNMYTVIYFDGITIRSFTPYCGNSVNVLFKTALGNECYTQIKASDLDTDLEAKVFPNGHKTIYDFSDECEYDAYVEEKVLLYYGLNDFDEAENSEVDLFKEIEDALM